MPIFDIKGLGTSSVTPKAVLSPRSRPHRDLLSTDLRESPPPQSNSSRRYRFPNSLMLSSCFFDAAHFLENFQISFCPVYAREHSPLAQPGSLQRLYLYCNVGTFILDAVFIAFALTCFRHIYSSSPLWDDSHPASRRTHNPLIFSFEGPGPPLINDVLPV